MPWRVPPKCEATCLVHLNGVSNAQDQRHRHVRVGLVGPPGVVEPSADLDRDVDVR